MLRRESLYSNQLSDWRREYETNGLAGLGISAPGPACSKTPEQMEIAKLEKQVAALERELGIANDGLEIQKKVLAFVERSNNGNTQ